MEPDLLLSASASTIVLAPVVGAYLCLSAFGLLRTGAASDFLADLCERPAAMHAVGAVAFFVGAGLLAVHRHWSLPAEIVLNLVAAWWAFEGAGMLADSARLRAALSVPKAPSRMRVQQWMAVPVGVYLLAIGLFGVAR